MPYRLPSCFLSAVLFLSGLAPTPASSLEVYRKVDRHGVIAFTNVPTDRSFSKIHGYHGRIRTRLPFRSLEPVITHHSKTHRLDPALVRAVIKAESDFDPEAVSRSGALGLMQLMPDTAARLAVQDPFNPEDNIEGGARYLRYLLDRFNGNLPLALAAYNAGATRVEHYRALPPIVETHRYVRKVLRYYRLFVREDVGHRSFTSASSLQPVAFSGRPLR